MKYMDRGFFCRGCYKNDPEGAFKFIPNEEGDTRCWVCNEEMTPVSITHDEYLTLWVVTKNNDLILAMNELKEKDPIEFQLKLADFEIKWQEMKKARDTTPKCPTCGSTNIQRISASSKAGSVFLFGLMSQKVKHQWHCNNCKYEW